MANLNVKVGLDRSGFQTGLAAMENAVQRFSGRLVGVLAAGIGVGAFVGATREALQLADRLDDLAKRYDINARGLQLIGNVAEENGASLESVSNALKFLGKNAQLASQQGAGDLAKAFASIGLSTSELRGLRPDEIFLRLSDALRSGKLAGQEFAVTSQLLGRGFEQLLPVLRLGREEIERIGASKGLFSEQQIAQLAQVQDFFEKINNLKKIATGDVSFGFIKSFKEFLGAGGAGTPARALRDLLFGQDKAPAGRRSGGSLITSLGAGLDADGQKLASENKKLAEDTDTFLRNLQIEREVDEIRRARNLERTRQQLKEETAQRERELAEENARGIASIEDIRAERSGPAAELALLQSRASGAADLARQTGSIQDTLAAEQAALALQNALQGRLQGLGFTGDEAAADARRRTEAAVGNLPQFSDTARAMEMNANNRPVQEPTVKDIASKMGETLDKLDELIRKTEGGVFTL